MRQLEAYVIGTLLASFAAAGCSGSSEQPAGDADGTGFDVPREALEKLRRLGK